MVEHIGESMTIDMLAAQAFLGRRQFTRVFRAETGTTPWQWLLDERLREARRLLERTDLPIDRIAHRCGFATAVSFRMHFRRAFGTNPSSYRGGHAAGWSMSEAVLGGLAGEGDARAQAELGQRVPHVGVDGVRRDPQLLGDFLVRRADRGELGYPKFGGSQARPPGDWSAGTRGLRRVGAEPVGERGRSGRAQRGRDSGLFAAPVASRQ
jgi:AraC-like DNA-binding protein